MRATERTGGEKPPARSGISCVADPARRAGIERVGEHFARKAQSGFSPLPLPE